MFFDTSFLQPVGCSGAVAVVMLRAENSAVSVSAVLYSW